MMTRLIVTAAVAAVLLSPARDAAAQRHGSGQGQTTANAAGSPSGQAPSPPSRFTSTLRSVPPPPPPVRPTPFSHPGFIGQGPFPFQRFAFWPWGAWLPVPIYTATTGYEPPPLEGAPPGGVQLDIDPRRAQVYVDGTYVGVVEEFSGYFRHLELPAGPHDIAVVAPGYEPLNLHVSVTPGATLTQRATLARAYGR